MALGNDDLARVLRRLSAASRAYAPAIRFEIFGDSVRLSARGVTRYVDFVKIARCEFNVLYCTANEMCRVAAAIDENLRQQIQENMK